MCQPFRVWKILGSSAEWLKMAVPRGQTADMGFPGGEWFTLQVIGRVPPSHPPARTQYWHQSAQNRQQQQQQQQQLDC